MVHKLIKRILFGILVLIVFITIFGLSTYFSISFLIKNEQTIIVPDLVGKDIVYCLEFLTNVGLNTKIKEVVYNENIPINYIVFQEPEPGSQVKKGRDVRLILSKGSKTLLMPNLKDLSLRKAELLVEEKGLVVRTLSKTYDDNVKNGDIVAQYPILNTRINRDTYVDLLISKGRRHVGHLMPDLDGLSLDDAILLIERCNLSLGNIQTATNKNKPQDVVVSQTPGQGYYITEKSPVDLVINKSSTTGNNIYNEKGVYLFRYKVESGFLKNHIRIIEKVNDSSNVVFDEYVKPNHEIWTLIQTDNTTKTILVYDNDKIVEVEKIK